jgi:hypothetical protein
LIAKIEYFVAHYNAKSKPFRWTATADSIFEKLQNFVKVLLRRDTRAGFAKECLDSPAPSATAPKPEVHVTRANSRRPNS